MKSESEKTTDPFRVAYLRARAEAVRETADTTRDEAMRAIAATYERIAERAEALSAAAKKKRADLQTRRPKAPQHSIAH